MICRFHARAFNRATFKRFTYSSTKTTSTVFSKTKLKHCSFKWATEKKNLSVFVKNLSGKHHNIDFADAIADCKCTKTFILSNIWQNECIKESWQLWELGNTFSMYYIYAENINYNNKRIWINMALNELFIPKWKNFEKNFSSSISMGWWLSNGFPKVN